MKKLFLIVTVIALIAGSMSCKKSTMSLLEGIWGLERIEYYNIDYYGHPIGNTIELFEYTPGDVDNGIDLVFSSNKKGEWRDRDVDTLFIKISNNPLTYDTIICPDTTIVTHFTYSYDEDQSALFLKTSDAETFMLTIETLNENTFIYTNEYKLNTVERAVLKRLDNGSKDRSSRKPSVKVPRKEGSFFRHTSLDEQH